MMMINCNNSNDYEEDSDPLVTDVLETESGIPKADGIDYLRDGNVAVQDIINIFKATLENVEQSLSRPQDPSSFAKDCDCQNVDGVVFPLEETSEIHPSESGSNEINRISKGISKTAYDFLKKLKFLIEYTKRRINVSPTEKQEQDRKLRHAIRSSRKTEMDIKLLNDALAIQRMEHKKFVDKLYEELNDCQNKTDRRNEEIKNEIRRIVNDSESEMVNHYKQSIAKQELLKSEIEISKTKLHSLRRNHIILEKELRDKRCKVETQLLNCIGKYDTDIGGRHRDMENFSREFHLLNTQRKMLEEDVMTNLRTLHDDLQQEKAEALQKILDERVEKYVRNRAAKVIQKAWRSYWERHCAKKKKKSRKKG